MRSVVLPRGDLGNFGFWRLDYAAARKLFTDLSTRSHSTHFAINFPLGWPFKMNYFTRMTTNHYRQRITIEPGKRGGKPCIRHMRITVYDILGWLAVGMSNNEILTDFPELTAEDIQAALAFAADRDHHLVAASA